MIEAAIFIPFVIVAVTQVVKMALPQVTGYVTVLLALALGVVVALVDTSIGVENVSVAQGLVLAGSAVGISALASKAGGGAKGDNNSVLDRDGE